MPSQGRLYFTLLCLNRYHFNTAVITSFQCGCHYIISMRLSLHLCANKCRNVPRSTRYERSANVDTIRSSYPNVRSLKLWQRCWRRPKSCAMSFCVTWLIGTDVSANRSVSIKTYIILTLYLYCTYNYITLILYLHCTYNYIILHYTYIIFIITLHL